MAIRKIVETESTKGKATHDAQSVVDMFDKSWQYMSAHHHKRFERNWKLYNNIRTSPGFQGITNTFVPMVFSTVETLTAALCGGRPSIDFMPQDMYKYIMSYAESGKKPDLKALNAQFDYFWDCDNWDLKSIKTVRGTFINGLAAEYIYWDGDKPRIINLPVRDLIIDPAMTDPMQYITDPKNTYGGRRYLTTLDALKEVEIVDPETGELKKRFKNLQNITAGFSEGLQMDKSVKEQMSMGTIGNTDNLIEVIEIWTGDTVRSVAQRTRVIEDRKNDLGIIPIALNRFLADESVLPGKAIVDPIAAPQELLNDVTNQSVDAVTDVLNPQYELDPAYSGWLPKIRNAPGVVYPFKPGSLQMIQKPSLGPNAFNERQNIKNEIREATGADQVVQGMQADGATTATEINAQLNQAGQRFEQFILMLEREGFYMRSKIVFQMMLTYIKEQQLVPTQSVDGPKFYVFDPAQYDDTFEPKIQLEARVKNAKAKDQQSAQASFQAIIQDPTNDLWEAKKILYPKMFDLTEEELDRVIGQQKPVPPAPPVGPDGMPVEPNAQPAPLPAFDEVPQA